MRVTFLGIVDVEGGGLQPHPQLGGGAATPSDLFVLNELDPADLFCRARQAGSAVVVELHEEVAAG
jgi:hypothetical protein